MAINKIIQEDLEIITSANIPWSDFAGKTILVSGANGVLPSYMVETLLFLSAHVLLNKCRVIALVRNEEKAKKRFADYLNRDDLFIIVQDVCAPIRISEKIDYIVHAASQASPKYYGTDPVGTLNANIFGTTNLLHLAKENHVQSFLYMSSSEVYGMSVNSVSAIAETDYGYLDPTQVRSCYAESKRMGENICISWKHQYSVPVKIVRPFHVYGPGMMLDDGRVFADFVADIVGNRDIIMKSDGAAKRAFCYLRDAALAFFYVMLLGEDGGVYNVGNDNAEISVLNLANTLVSLFPEKQLKVVIKANDNSTYLPSPVMRNLPDVTRLNKLGWYPKVTIEEGFQRTIKSYEHN